MKAQKKADEKVAKELQRKEEEQKKVAKPKAAGDEEIDPNVRGTLLYSV